MEGEHKSPATIDNDQRRKKREQVRLKYAQINKGSLTPNEHPSRPQPSQHFPGAYPAESEIFTNSEQSRDSSRNKRESLTRLKEKSKVLRQKFDSIKNNIDRQVNGDSPKRASPRVYAGRINRSLQNLNEPRLLKSLKTEEDLKIAAPQSARKEQSKKRYQSRYSYRPNEVKLNKYNTGAERARESGLNRLSSSAQQFLRAQPKSHLARGQGRGPALNLKQKLNLKFDYSKPQNYRQFNSTPYGQFQNRYSIRPPSQLNSYLHSQPLTYQHFHHTDAFYSNPYRHPSNTNTYFDPKSVYQLASNRPANRFRIQLPERSSGFNYQGPSGLMSEQFAGMSKGFALAGRDKMTLPVQQTSSIIIYSDEGQRAVKPRNLMWDLLDRQKKHRPYHI